MSEPLSTVLNRRVLRFIVANTIVLETLCDSCAEAEYTVQTILADTNAKQYDRIAIMNARCDLVERIWERDEDGNWQEFCERDVVRLRPSYCSEEERKYLYMLRNIHEDTGHCTITCLNAGTALPSSEFAELYMLDKVCDADVLRQTVEKESKNGKG